MDYGIPKYGKPFVEDVKAVLNVAYMFLPFPIFWALFDQQGSRWVFQARHMNGDIKITTFLPDQMQVIAPVLILVFIPFFDYVMYLENITSKDYYWRIFGCSSLFHLRWTGSGIRGIC